MHLISIVMLNFGKYGPGASSSLRPLLFEQ